MIWAKWDAITTPKSFGGLGVKDLMSFNKALLGKWAWRAIGGGEFLWLQIVRESERWEEGRTSGRELIGNHQRAGGWWGVVLDSLSDREGEWFRSAIYRKVGSGSSTSFWEDVWVGDSCLKSAFPRLYEVSLDKSCTVAEAGKWVENMWVWSKGWRRALRDWETASLVTLLECRKQVPHNPDGWEWKPESSKIFSVRSAYELLLTRKLDVNVGMKNFCTLIWRNFAIPRAQATTWRLLLGRLATRT